MNEVKNMTDFTKDTLKMGGKEIATKVIPVVFSKCERHISKNY
ncbi:hypothetical protein QI302_11775 [Staphylococcus saprophyticus]|nr:hypothetical protein [Staphylococcus saprophyticus]MDW3928281.1 hypothetical protein [Staphylococcus saprophyticus]MDW4097920.1 hypothetical protein [Staphylococcus saprophyticus]